MPLSKFVKVLGLGTSLVVVVGSVATASLLPGAPSIFGDGGDFYDFGSEGLGSIFEDINGVFDVDSILGNGGFTGQGGSIFDTVFGEVSQTIGIPPEILGVLNGGSIDGILGGILDDVLGDIGLGDLGDILGGTLPDVFGASGIPDVGDLLDVLYGKDAAKDASIFGTNPSTPSAPPVVNPDAGSPLGSAPAITTINVIPSLIRPLQAIAAVTQATTAVGLTTEGQELTAARRTAGTTVVGVAEQMGTTSSQLSQLHVQTAQGLDPLIHGQDSTQKTLKEALSNMALLDAQATQLDAFANEQRALALQLETLALDTSIEARNGIFADATNTELLNQQLFRNHQRDLSDDTSTRLGLSRGTRSLGAMR